MHWIWKCQELAIVSDSLVLYTIAIQLCNGMDKIRVKLFEGILVSTLNHFRLLSDV